jgi:hypothetical protein
MKTAEELRIGNVLLFENEAQVVSSIHSDNTIRLKKTKDDKCHGCYRVDAVTIKPIPITEDWLLKFGFERTFKKLKGCYVDKHGKYMLCDNNENGFDIYIFGYDEDLYINSVNYIHQLQNLYFALTGEELICK